MTIAFYSNFFNHHQALVADELYKLTEGNYYFIETMQMPNWISKSGYPKYDKPYLIRAWQDAESQIKAIRLLEKADVCVLGGPETLEYAVRRAKLGGLTFEVGERSLKRGWLNLLSPRLLKSQWYYHTLFSQKQFYSLCSSAFSSTDLAKLHSYKNRCYKWGYFTNVPDIDRDEFVSVDKSNTLYLMWCARFLWWKHPELPIRLAEKLKNTGYKFHLDMFGTGKKLDEMKHLAASLNLLDTISFKGNKPNSEILSEMSSHDIFLFTSDRNDGWGAVANESMSNGCVLVGSDEIGSVPYLIQDGENGLIFKSKNVDSLYENVKFLLDNPSERLRLRQNAVRTMQTIWSPKVAARNLLTLIDDLQHGRDTSIAEGPCSKA